MSKVLILGFSRIAQKKIIPALEICTFCESITIASVSGFPEKEGKIVEVYTNYDSALEAFQGDFIYISLPNSLHDKYLIKSMQMGFNCIVDKPAILNPNSMKLIDEFCLKGNIFVAEAVVFQYHSAWKEAIALMGGKNQIQNIVAEFTIPRLPDSDFRTKEKCGGGAVNDMSAYAMGIGRDIWGASPIQIKVTEVVFEDMIPTKYLAIIDYGEGRAVEGLFGFGCDYSNKIAFIGAESRCEMNFPFSAPKNMEILIDHSARSYHNLVKVEPSDSFLNFFNQVFLEENSSSQQHWINLVKDSYMDLELLQTAVYKAHKLHD